MKCILMVIVFCVASLDLSARVAPFNSPFVFICSQCGAQLSYQELLLNQILLAGKDTATLLCDGCRTEDAKGKKEKEVAGKEASAALLLSINQEYYYPDTFFKVSNKEVNLHRELLRKNAENKKNIVEEKKVEKKLLKIPAQTVKSGNYILSLLSSGNLLLQRPDGVAEEMLPPDRTRNSKTGEAVSYFVLTGLDGIGNGKFLLFSKQPRSKDDPYDDKEVRTIFELDAVKEIFTLVPKPKVSFLENSSDVTITVEDYD